MSIQTIFEILKEKAARTLKIELRVFDKAPTDKKN